MKSLNKIEKIGFVFIAIGVLYFILDNILKLEPFVLYPSLGRYIFAIGVGLWVTGYFQRKKEIEK